MLQTRRWLFGALALLMVAGTCFAEDAEPAKFYKLEFVVKEFDGSRLINSRAYSSMVTSAHVTPNMSIRTGSKIPLEKGTGAVTSFSTIDVGVNFDVRDVQEVQSRLECRMSLEISSVAKDPAVAGHPVIRQSSWNGYVTLPFKKPTTVYTSDDADSKTQTQLEVTAIPIPQP